MNKLISARQLTRNVIWNLSGALLPLIVALWAFPILINGLGNERFGLLAIIWMGVGYFSIFDLGLGAAVTKLVAERLGNGRTSDIPELASTSQRLMWGCGILASLMVILLAPWLVERALKIPQSMQQEARWSLTILATTIPFVVSSAGLTGILQAYQKAAWISLVRLPLGIMNFLGPVLMLKLSSSLELTTLFLAGSRLLSFWCFRHLVSRLYPSSTMHIRREHIRELFSFGGWITVSSVVGPIMVYFDRFVIGSVLGLTAVAFYTTPFELVVRLWIIPDAVVSTLFPALTVALIASRIQAAKMIDVATLSILLAVGVPAGIVMLFAAEGLDWWLGPEYAQQSAQVMQLLAIGVFINSFARVPAAIVNAAGHPHLIAKLHLVELPLYLLVLYACAETWGIFGVALAWLMRVILDTLAICGFACLIARDMQTHVLKGLLALCVTLSLLLALCEINILHLKLLGLLLITLLGLWPAIVAGRKFITDKEVPG